MNIDKDIRRLQIAVAVSAKANCSRRSVGCLLYDKDGMVLSGGYNSTYDSKQCSSDTCTGINSATGQDLHLCKAVHAEQLALMLCRRPGYIHTCYVTASPCMHCIKMLAITNCQRIVFIDVYDQSALDVWTSLGRTFKQIS